LKPKEFLKLGLELEETEPEETEDQGYVIEERESEPWNPQAESFDEYRKRIGGSGHKLDVKSVEDLRGAYEDALQERDNLQSKLDIIVEKEFERKKRELGAPEDITTVEQLIGFEKAQQEQTEKPPSGNVPLAGQFDRSIFPFSSPKEVFYNGILLSLLTQRLWLRLRRSIDRLLSKNSLAFPWGCCDE